GSSGVGRAFHDAVIGERVAALGHVPLDPWSNTPPPGIDTRLAEEIVQIAAAIAKIGDAPDRRAAWQALNPRIGAKNAALIDAADIVLAVVDGTDGGTGTAAGAGIAYAQSRPDLRS